MATRKAIALVSGLFQEVNTPTDKLDLAGNSTTDLAEGSNQYFTTARARSSISAATSGTGYGSLTYSTVTGIVTYSVVTDANIRGSLTVAAGSGLTYNNTTGQFGTSAIPNSQLANSSVTVGNTSISLGGTATTITGLTSLTSTAINVGVAGTAGSITLDVTGIVFEGGAADVFETTLSVAEPTADRIINLPDASGTIALLSSLSVSNSGTGYGSLSYNNVTGVLTYNVVTNANIRGALTASTTGTGYGSLTYNSSTGNYDFAVVTDASIRGSLTVAAGSGLTYNSTTGQFGTSAIPNAQLANSSITVGTTSIALGSSSTTLAGLTSVTSTGITTNDSGFRIRNTTDITRQIAFDASGIATATTRTLTVPDANGTLALLGTNNAFTGANTFTNATGQTYRQAATQDGFIIQGRAGGTSSYAVTFTTATLTASRTVTFPDAAGTVLLDTSSLPATFSDSAFRVQDNGDATKQLAFECSGISTATTRTMTVPNENGTISTQDFATAIAVALG